MDSDKKWDDDRDRAGKQVLPQGQHNQKMQQDHFFSGLANRNLDHILTNIVSHLPGRDVRSCLWTCRALRHAAMSNREAMNREAELRFELKPRRVSDEFEADLDDDMTKRHFSDRFLVFKASNTHDSEVDNIMENVDLKVLAPKTISGFGGQSWRDKIEQIVGFPHLSFCLLDAGDLVLVNNSSNIPTDCCLIRLDDKEENGGKIIDKWNHLDMVPNINNDLLEKTATGYYVPIYGQRCRRGNMIFYVYAALLKKEATPGLLHEFYCFALMVDLEEDKVLWKKMVGTTEWDDGKPFVTDQFCGFLACKDYDRKRVRKFDIKTGMEIEPEELLWLNDEMEVASGNDAVALITGSKHHEPFNFFCHMVDGNYGLTTRYHGLVVPNDGSKDFLDMEIGVLPTYFDTLSNRFSLFNRTLAMCNSHVAGDNRAATTCFAFWNLEEPIKRAVKYGIPNYMTGESFHIVKDVNVDLVMARVVWLDGFINIGPSLSGNVWFLLSSENYRREGDTRKKVWHTMHAVNINRSVATLLTHGHNLSEK